MGCHVASLQYCSCPHETMMPIKCDRIACHGMCRDEPERRQCLCLVRYLWSYEGCTMRNIQKRYKREFDGNDARETEIIESHDLEAGDVDALLETLNERWEWWQGKLTAQENEMREEIMDAVKWTRRFATILAGMPLPVTEVGKMVVSRVIRGKPTEMLIVQDTMHTRAKLMLIQMPPRPLGEWASQYQGV